MDVAAEDNSSIVWEGDEQFIGSEEATKARAEGDGPGDHHHPPVIDRGRPSFQLREAWPQSKLGEGGVVEGGQGLVVCTIDVQLLNGERNLCTRCNGSCTVPTGSLANGRYKKEGSRGDAIGEPFRPDDCNLFCAMWALVPVPPGFGN